MARGDLKGVTALDVSLENILKKHNSILSLPKYQRGFVWKPDKVERLLIDLESNKNAAGVHNMFAGGVLLLKIKCLYGIDWNHWSVDRVSKARLASCNKLLAKAALDREDELEIARKEVEKLRPTAKIVDGQQRITTATILAKVLMEKCLALGLLRTRADQLGALLMFDGHNRLRLKSEDDDDLQTIIEKHTEAEPLTSTQSDYTVWAKRGTGAKGGANPMCKAYTTIVQWLENKLTRETTLKKKRKWINNYSKFLMKNLGFIMVTVKNEGQAHLVFRAMNSTGEGLTDGELIKSHLFYRDRTIQNLDMEMVWASISTHLDELRTGQSDIITDFFFNYGRSIGLKGKTKKGGKLPKQTTAWAHEQHCSEENMNDGKFKSFCTQLKNEAQNYKWIHEPPGYTQWPHVTRKDDLIDLNGIGFKQHVQVLMSARRHLTDPEFDEVIKVITTMVGRVFLVQDISPSKKEDDWAKWAGEFNDKGSTFLPIFKREVFDFIKERYPGKTTKAKLDSAFKAEIKTTVFNQSHAKHFLREAEGLVGNPFGEYTKRDLQAEHIFPKNASKSGPWYKNGHRWSDPDKHKNMLGNYIILESAINNCFTRTRAWKVHGKFGLRKPKAKKNWGKYHGFRYFEWELSAGGTMTGSQLEAVKNFHTKHKNLKRWSEREIEDRTKELTTAIVNSGHWWFTP